MVNITDITVDGIVTFPGHWARNTAADPLVIATAGDLNGFIEFDTTDIPDGATITSISLFTYSTNDIPAPQAQDIISMAGKQLSDYADDEAGNTELSGDLAGNDTIGTANLDASESGDWYEFVLNADAKTYMGNQLGDNYFMFGIQTSSGTVDSEEGSNPAYLVVEYTGGGGGDAVQDIIPYVY